jgi:hypothetical protein
LPKAVRNIHTLAPASGSPAHGRWHASSAIAVRISDASQQTTLLQFGPDGTFTRLLSTSDPMPALGTSTYCSSLGLPAISSDGTKTVVKTTVKALLPPGIVPPVTAKNDTALAFHGASEDGFSVIAREGANVPGVDAPAAFFGFQDPIVNTNGHIAFVATLGGKGITGKNKTGLWWGEAGAPQLLARTGALAPDSTGAPSTAVWSKFTSMALPDGPEAGPVFLAGLAGPGVSTKNNIGLWALDSTGVLRRLVRTGDVVDGKPVIGINALAAVPGALGTSRGFNARGAVVVRLLFAKGAQSIVRIDVPE